MAALIFSINAGSTTFSTAHAFSEADGKTPCGGLIEASDNNLYGSRRLVGPLAWEQSFACL